MKGKGNGGLGDVPERDEWRTDQELWDELDKQYGFGFDCCATSDNSKTEKYSNDFEKLVSVGGVAWMNPPFSKARRMFEHFFKVVRRGVAIYRCDNMETKLWQEVILENADWVFIPKGRVSYTPFETGNMRGGKGTRFPSALIGVGVDKVKDIEGKTLEVE